MTDPLAVLFDASVKLAVLGLPVWLATRRAGVAQARLAHAAWLGVLAASAALPFLSLWVAPSASLVPAPAVRDAFSASVAAPGLGGWTRRAYALVAAAMLLRLAAGAWQIRR